MMDELLPDTPEKIEATQGGVVRRWLAEIDLASKAEKEWRNDVNDLWEIYESGKLNQDQFNILWSNTEILRPAIYNSTPKPDVRRRHRDRDVLSKVVSEVTARSLSYLIDGDDFETSICFSALDLLVTGRGVAWVEYEVETAPVGEPIEGQEAQERIVSESAKTVHVQWDDFRRGPGKTWKQVQWVARRHRMDRAELIEMFGEDLGKRVTLDSTEGNESKEAEKGIKEAFRTACVWEIWDKAKKRRLYITESIKEAPLKAEPAPLSFKDFFPCPRPCYAIENSRTLVPKPLYMQYKKQAAELNSQTNRISELIAVLKVRGFYLPGLAELENLFQAGNNDFIPVENVSFVAQLGDINKALWIMPLDKIVQALEALYIAREQTKQTIYEITGISDILRGSTKHDETLGAQQLKSQWGTMRLQRMQKEIQRFVRDIIRLKAEIISETFQPETIMEMTNVELPTIQQKQQIQMHLQSGVQDPALMKVMNLPTWEEVLRLMRSDKMRGYKIDIETDSTVEENINRDMVGLGQLMQSLASWMQVLAPAVQTGALPAEAAKEMTLAVVRRARLGTVVEDAIEEMDTSFQQPKDPTEEQLMQLDGAKQTILDLVKNEGVKSAQKEQGLQAYDQQVQQSLGNVNEQQQTFQQFVQMAVQQITAQQEAANQTQMQAGQLGQVLQGFLQTQQQMQQEQSLMINTLTQSQAQVLQALQQMAAAVNSRKAISIKRGKSGEWSGSATPIVQ